MERGYSSGRGSSSTSLSVWRAASLSTSVTSVVDGESFPSSSCRAAAIALGQQRNMTPRARKTTIVRQPAMGTTVAASGRAMCIAVGMTAADATRRSRDNPNAGPRPAKRPCQRPARLSPRPRLSSLARYSRLPTGACVFAHQRLLPRLLRGSALALRHQPVTASQVV
jgi:hypothetical protein